MKFYSSKKAGFTLIELLVVISIIGMLSSVILVNLKGARDKARDTRIITDIRSVRTQLEIDKDNNGAYGAGISPVISNRSCISFTGTGLANYTALQQDIYNNSSARLSCIYSNAIAGAFPPLSTYPNHVFILVQNSAVVVGGAWSPFTTSVPTAYALYGKMNTGKYFCIDSTGGVTAAAGISITKPSGAPVFQLTCAAN